MSQKTYKNLFILGAGASCPYGYPTGEGLTNEIVTTCIQGRNSKHEILKQEYHPSIIEEFGKSLRASNQMSIDAFLKERKDYEEIGKHAIALHILERESQINQHYPQKGNWLKYLVSRVIGNDIKKFQDANMNFITFNYDRSLEFLLHSTVASLFKLDNKKSSQIINRFIIHHFYGRLGSLPQHEENEHTEETPIPFGVKIREALNYGKLASKNIKVMHDQRIDKLDEPYKDYFYHSERIFILGFGFDSLNIKRLDIDWKKVDGEIWSSAYNMSQVEKNRAFQLLGIGEEKLKFVDGDSEHLLRQTLQAL